MVIHPGQIDTVNEHFALTVEQIEEACQIVDEYNRAQLEGKGVVQWKGKMLDEPILKRAQRVLQKIRVD